MAGDVRPSRTIRFPPSHPISRSPRGFPVPASHCHARGWQAGEMFQRGAVRDEQGDGKKGEGGSKRKYSERRACNEENHIARSFHYAVGSLSA